MLMRAAPSRIVVRALAADRRWLVGGEGACESMLLRMWERGAAIVVVVGGVRGYEGWVRERAVGDGMDGR